MNLLDSFKDIGGMGVGGVIGAGVVWLSKAVAEYLKDDNKSKNELKKAEIETAPDLAKVTIDGIFKLLTENRTEITLLRTEIYELRDEVSDLNDHIDNLTGVLKANNITPPPRRRRVKSESPVD